LGSGPHTPTQLFWEYLRGSKSIPSGLHAYIPNIIKCPPSPPPSAVAALYSQSPKIVALAINNISNRYVLVSVTVCVALLSEDRSPRGTDNIHGHKSMNVWLITQQIPGSGHCRFLVVLVPGISIPSLSTHQHCPDVPPHCMFSNPPSSLHLGM